MSKNYVLLPNGELRRGEIIRYVDLDESELCHWKYIKREKLPNGKYRYYYDVEQLKDDLGVDERERLHEATKYKNSVEGYEKDLFDKWVNSKDSAADGADAKAWAQAIDLKKRAGIKYVSAKEAYMKTPLGKLEKIAPSVSKFLSNLFSKKKK